MNSKMSSEIFSFETETKNEFHRKFHEEFISEFIVRYRDLCIKTREKNVKDNHEFTSAISETLATVQIDYNRCYLNAVSLIHSKRKSMMIKIFFGLKPVLK